MWDCVKQHIKRVTNSDGEVDITQLYYKKSKRKTVVKLSGDGDVLALLNEYPLTYKSGKRKRETTMYLAVDLKKGMLEWLEFFVISIFHEIATRILQHITNLSKRLKCSIARDW